jgi:hypothetical protein
VRESRRIRNIYRVLGRFTWLPTSLFVGKLLARYRELRDRSRDRAAERSVQRPGRDFEPDFVDGGPHNDDVGDGLGSVSSLQRWLLRAAARCPVMLIA